MKVKKIPMRSCCVTRERLEKRDLIRVVRTPEGEVKVDLTGKCNGRGCYVKKDKEVIQEAKKKKVFQRQLEVEIPDSVYEELLSIVDSNLE